MVCFNQKVRVFGGVERTDTDFSTAYHERRTKFREEKWEYRQKTVFSNFFSPLQNFPHFWRYFCTPEKEINPRLWAIYQNLWRVLQRQQLLWYHIRYRGVQNGTIIQPWLTTILNNRSPHRLLPARARVPSVGRKSFIHWQSQTESKGQSWRYHLQQC